MNSRQTRRQLSAVLCVQLRKAAPHYLDRIHGLAVGVNRHALGGKRRGQGSDRFVNRGFTTAAIGGVAQQALQHLRPVARVHLTRLAAPDLEQLRADELSVHD
jgi:hypothetical protein